MFAAFLKRALAVGCALLTIALTAGLSPQTVSRQRPLIEPQATLGPDDAAISIELARIHARPGPDAGGPDVVNGGLVHVVAVGETLQSIAIEYRLAASAVLDANNLRRSGEVRPGLPLRLPVAAPLTSTPMAGGGRISYKASAEDHFPWGWCTWYVAQRRDVPWHGDAKTWVASARALGWLTGDAPRVGAMMVTNESYAYGHVAYVEKVFPDGSWTVSEMNYAGFGLVDLRTIRPSQAKQVSVVGFIY